MVDPESKEHSTENETPTEEFLVAMAYVPPSGLESLYPPTTHDIVGPLDQIAIPDYSIFEPLIENLPANVMTAEQLFEFLAAEEPPVRSDDTASTGVVYASDQVGVDTGPSPVVNPDEDDFPAEIPDSNVMAKLIRFTQFIADDSVTNESNPVPPLKSDHIWYQYDYLEHPLNMSYEEEIRANDEYHSLEGTQNYFELQPLNWVINYFLALANHLQIFDPHFFFDDLIVTELVIHDENWCRKYLWRHFGQLAQMPGGIGSDVPDPNDVTNRELKQMTVLESIAVGLEFRRLALWLLFAEVFGENKRILPYPKPLGSDKPQDKNSNPRDDKQ